MCETTDPVTGVKDQCNLIRVSVVNGLDPSEVRTRLHRFPTKAYRTHLMSFHTLTLTLTHPFFSLTLTLTLTHPHSHSPSLSLALAHTHTHTHSPSLTHSFQNSFCVLSKVLLDSLVSPTLPITEWRSNIHGIGEDDLQGVRYIPLSLCPHLHNSLPLFSSS
jgi:hypothetical protein